jgi:hypothetical protein
MPTGNIIKIQRLSPVLVIITNEYGEMYSINSIVVDKNDEMISVWPISDKEISEIINDNWSFWDVKATYQLIYYDK